MILDIFERADAYRNLHPEFATAIQFVRAQNWQNIKDGRHPIEAEGMFALIATNPPLSTEVAQLESHQRYIDLQYIIDGTEEIGWKSLKDGLVPTTEYDPKRDIRFYQNRPDCWLKLKAGTFAIFYPEDAHAPGVSTATVRKVVVKIAV